MATTLSGLHASASAAVTACRTCPPSHQQETSVNVVCTSLSSQFSRQGGSCSSVTKTGFLETRSHARVSQFLKPKQSLRLRATTSAELEAVSSEVATEDAVEVIPSPETMFSSGDVSKPAVELSGSESADTSALPTQFEDAARLGQDGSQAADTSSGIVTGDITTGTPSAEEVPSLLDAINSTSDPAPAVDVLKSSSEDGGAGDAVLSAQERYIRMTEGRGWRLDQLETDPIGDAIKGAQDSLKSAQDAATTSVESLLNAVRDAVDSASSSVQNVYESVNGSIVRVIKSTGSSDKTLDDLQSNGNGTQGVSIDFTSVFRVGTPANDTVKEIVTVVKTATGSALGGAGKAISQVYTSTKDIVPEEFQSFLNTAEEKVSQLSGPVGSAIDQAFITITEAEKAVGLDPENAIIPVILVIGGSLFLGFGYFNIRYGGYSGDLLPSAALDLLKMEKNVVLVDIRPQKAREAQGIPDLRRSARSKFAVVEVVKVEGAVRGLLKNVNDIEVALTAAVIRNLKNVNRSSKIIVLDEEGGQSKQIARGLRRTGFRRAYLVHGGFKAWTSSGLRSKAEGPQSPLMILQEDAEAIVEEVKPTKSGIFAVLLGLVAGTYAVLEWEKTLQLIGILGLVTTIFIRVESYESVEDAKADLRLLQKPFNVVLEGIVWVAGLVEPKKLQLATSPASSNVQGRVIQAAAKHGPISSELELDEDEENVVAAVEEDVGGDDSTQTQHTSLQEPQ